MNSSEQVTILVIEDNPHQLGFLSTNLDLAGYIVRQAADGLQAKMQIDAAVPDLILLDLQIPYLNGGDLLKWLRGFSNVPVIIITGKDAEDDKVRGLEMGADDYLVKPVGSRELQARVKAALRRARLAAPDGGIPEPYENGGLRIDYAGYAVTVDGRPAHLAPIEYKLLCALADHTGVVLSHDDLLRWVWGDEYEDGDAYLVRAVVHRLRKAIEADPANPVYVQTVPRVGYCLAKVRKGD
ncbi:MAG: response regulator transcription factor [Anaerolineae bacterium]|nr:response regulator transcription factor [Anaerolineae bacterium]